MAAITSHHDIPSMEDEGTTVHHVAVGREPFSLVPPDLIDADGTMDVEALCSVLASVSSVLTLALRGTGAASFSPMEQEGLTHLTSAIAASFLDLSVVVGDAMERLKEKRATAATFDLSEPGPASDARVAHRMKGGR